MSPEAQRLFIADSLGIKTEACREALVYFKGRDGYPDAVFQLAKIPDYLNDLNGMFSAEEWINEDSNRGYQYDMALCKVVKAYEGINEPCNHLRLYHATAAQRAEAFLRTLNLWTDEPAAAQRKHGKGEE